MQIRDIMAEPMFLDKGETLSHAMDVMEKNGVQRLLVMHNGDINGVVTIRTILRSLGSRKSAGMPASSLHVASATTDNFTKVFPDLKSEEAITLVDRTGGVLIVMDGNELLGWITPREILKNAINLEESVGDSMIADLITIHPTERVSHARRLMLDENIGRLPVVEEDRLVGIVTEQDIAKAMRAFRDLVPSHQQDNRIKKLLVEDIMKRQVTTVNVDTPIGDVVRTMLKEDIGGIPILNGNDELAGIITQRSIIRVLAKRQ